MFLILENNICFYINSECSFTKSCECVQSFVVFSYYGNDDAHRGSKDSKRTVFNGSLGFE